MDNALKENARKVKISYLLSQKNFEGNRLSKSVEPAKLRPQAALDTSDEIKRRLDVCHKKLQRNNQLLSRASSSLKNLNIEEMRQQMYRSRVIDTAECLQQDEDELTRHRELLERQLADFRLKQQAKQDMKKEERLQQDFDTSLREIIDSFSKMKEQVSKQ